QHEFEKAVETVTEIVESHPRGFLDQSPDVSWQFDEADIAVVEMTAVAFDWLSSGKPLVMIRPQDPEAEVLEGGLLDQCLTVQPNGRVGIEDLIDEAVSRAGSIDDLANFYLGDTATGAQTARFIRSSEWVIGRRTEEHRLKCNG